MKPISEIDFRSEVGCRPRHLRKIQKKQTKIHPTLSHSAAARFGILWQDHRLASEPERMNERQNDGVERQRRGSWRRSGGNLKVLCYGRANISSNRSDLFPLNVICCLCLLGALLEFPGGNEGAT